MRAITHEIPTETAIIYSVYYGLGFLFITTFFHPSIFSIDFTQARLSIFNMQEQLGNPFLSKCMFFSCSK